MARQYEGKVAFVGLGSRDDLSRLEAFVAEHDLGSFPHVADETGALRSRLGVVGQPTWIFLDAAGRADKVFGPLGEAGLAARLDGLLAP